MRSYSEEKWFLTRDAHGNQAAAFSKYLNQLGHDVDVLIPSKNDLDTMPNFFQDSFLIPDSFYSVSIKDQRHNFKSKDLLKTRYNVIFTGHIEYVEFLRKLYPDSRIISVFTHGPLMNREYKFRNRKNILQSDLVLYNFRKDLIEDLIREFGEDKFQACYRYSDVSLSTYALDLKPRKNTILMPSRLNDRTRYNLENLNIFFKKLKNDGFEIYYTDPNESSLFFEGTLIHQINRFEWLYLLRKMDYIFIPYDTETTFSAIQNEAMLMGTKIITQRPKHHYSRLSVHSQLYFEEGNFESLDNPKLSGYDQYDMSIEAKKSFSIDSNYTNRLFLGGEPSDFL